MDRRPEAKQASLSPRSTPNIARTMRRSWHLCVVRGRGVAWPLERIGRPCHLGEKTRRREDEKTPLSIAYCSGGQIAPCPEVVKSKTGLATTRTNERVDLFKK